MTLSSNASTQFYPENVLGHFWNRLSEPIQLTDCRKWEVALTEISTPHSMVGTRWRDRQLELRLWTKLPLEPGTPPVEEQTKKMVLKPFDTTKVFEKQYNDNIDPLVDIDLFREGLRIEHPLGPNSLRLELAPNLKIFFSDRLLNVLGLNRKELNEDGSIGSESQPTVYQGFVDWQVGRHSLWVHSNCCAHRLVGDLSVPLLRTLLLSEKDVGRVFKSVYIHPHYIPVSQNFFSALEVYITDNTGKDVSFFPGEVVMTLHFRRRREQ